MRAPPWIMHGRGSWQFHSTRAIGRLDGQLTLQQIRQLSDVRSDPPYLVP